MANEIVMQTAQNADDMMAFSLDSMEIDAIGEILNISMGSAATAVSTLLSRKVNITTPAVSVVKTDELRLDNLEPAIGIEIEYVEGLTGNNLLVMKRSDIKAIVNLLLSDMEGADDETLDEIHISAVSEIMNQMMGASSTALANFLGKNINISTPKPFDIAGKSLAQDIQEPYMVNVSFNLEVEDLLNSEFVTVMTVGFTKDIVKSALNFDDVEESSPAENKEPVAMPQPVQSQAVPAADLNTGFPKDPKEEKQSNGSVNDTSSVNRANGTHEMNGMNGANEKAAPVSVKPVKLQSFDDEKENGNVGEEHNNFNLILGVPLDVSVEIGRTRLPVKNILDIRQGSIVELDRQAGDPVDIIVNGQLIAKGDVVIIDDNFGVRITEILSPKDISKQLS